MIIERDSIETDCKELADNLRKPDFDEALIFDKGMSIQSSTNSNVFFETMDILERE